ncbi:glycosyltransferase family 4 protein [Thermoactinomyces mirandus]|uniref:Glycosyltransferase family 4 protein n=1 Tax=Thermoactinomyces mirandus TaxID=2756294 RepID=A0A7W1XUR0_9BACL|nr:glycosyltransferase family 4 protein [Thermoactinomyces mirandus]MBA4603654.1 glycosyltransferase family 4 protein [Thermoactinomyces mirandus]
MNILFVCEYFWPVIGGLERSTERLAEEFVRKGHTVRVLTKVLPDTKKYENRNGMMIYRFSNDDLTFTENAEGHGIMEDAEVICLFGVGHDIEAKHWEPLFRRGVPVFVKIGTQGDVANKGIRPENFLRFNGILCQNDAIAEEAISIGVPKEKCFEIRNGLSIRRWQSNLLDKMSARKKLGVSENAFVCSAIGRFVERKKFPLIINSFFKVLEDMDTEDKEVKLLLQGSDFGQHDGEEKYIREMVDNSRFRSNVVYISPYENTGLTLSASDVFITMGLREGAPNIIIEAFASGCPVIASDIPGHDVYIKDKEQGLLVDTDSDQLAAAILDLYKNKELRHYMTQQALERSFAFDIQLTSDDYLKCFKNALANS